MDFKRINRDKNDIVRKTNPESYLWAIVRQTIRLLLGEEEKTMRFGRDDGVPMTVQVLHFARLIKIDKLISAYITWKYMNVLLGK